MPLVNQGVVVPRQIELAHVFEPGTIECPKRSSIGPGFPMLLDCNLDMVCGPIPDLDLAH